MLIGYFQNLGVGIFYSTAHSGFHLGTAAIIFATVATSGAAGFGLLIYDILKNRKAFTRLVSDKLKRQQARKKLDQIHKKNSEQNEEQQ
jgi:hypothetical protein